MTVTTLEALSILNFATQEQRLLRLDFPRDDGPDGAILLVNSLTATEDVSRDFRFEAELLSDDAHVALKAMMGRMVTCANQHNETDYNHLHRRWEALGLYYWYEHRADGHTLWLADNSTLADVIETASGDGAIHFHSESGSMEDDSMEDDELKQWQAVRRLGSGQLTLASFDYKNPQPRLASGHSLNRQDGNIDHPIVIGVVYNSSNMPPWQLPQQRALSGVRSRELGARSANHLVFDDTRASIQAQLRSEHQDSHLSLGNITRIDDNAGCKEARGAGFELASNTWGALRAAKGMLITTETQADTIKQLAETLARLAQARQLQQGLAAMAVSAGAQDSAEQQGSVAEAIKHQNAAIKGSGKDFPELSEPHLVLASPAGIELSTAQSVHLAASEHVAISSSKHISLASGDSIFASIARTFSLFVHKAGMKLIAASGKVSIEAHSDEVEVIAKKV